MFKDMSAAWGVLAVVSSLTGCTLQDGRGFAHLSGELQAHFPSPEGDADRLTADGWFRADDGYEVKIEAMELHLHELVLSGGHTGEPTASNEDSCVFDESSPPKGCSNCHGGHCHCDGELVSYEELQAESCAVTASHHGAVLGELHLHQTLDPLSESARVAIPEEDPACELPSGELSELQLTIESFTARGLVRDSSGEARLASPQVPFEVALEHQVVLTENVSPHEPIDRGAPHDLVLELEIHLPDQLFDKILWSKLTSPGEAGLSINDPADPAGKAITANLAASHLHVHIQRGEES